MKKLGIILITGLIVLAWVLVFLFIRQTQPNYSILGVAGTNDYSLDLEATDKECVMGTESGTPPTDMSGSFTIEAWIKPESISDDMYVFSRADESVSNNILQGFRLQSTGVMKLYYYNGGYVAVTATSTLSTGVWTHVAVVHNDSTDEDRIYINGVIDFIDTGQTTNATSDSDADVAVGCHAKSLNSNVFDGLIDDVRVWNVARTATQINENKDAELNGNESGLAAYWKMENDLTDDTSGGLDLSAYDNEAPDSATFSVDVPFEGGAPAPNNPPTISSVTDAPDPVDTGSTTVFSVDWYDADTDGVHALICKTDSIATGTYAVCPGGSWAVATSSYSTDDPSVPEYSPVVGDVGENDYYAFVCDNEVSCSTSTSGTFTVEQAPYAGSVTVTSPTQHSIIQRSSTATGTVLVSGTFTDAPTAIQAKVVMASSSEVVKDWTVIDDSPSGGTFSANLTDVPQGSWYNIVVSATDATSTSATSTTQVGIGILVGCIGQSNIENWFTDGTDNTATSTLMWYNETGWITPTTTGNGAIEFGNRISNATNLPVGLLDYGVSGAYLSSTTNTLSWVYEGADNMYEDFTDGVTAVGGNLEYIIWIQGVSDALDSISEAQYESDLNYLFTKVRSDVGYTLTGNLPIVMSTLLRYSSGVDADWQAIRNAEQDYADGDSDTYLMYTLEFPVSSYHYTEAGLIGVGNRMAQGVLYLLGEETYWQGAAIDNFVLNAADIIDVNLTHRSGTDFTPTTAITGFTVFDDASEETITDADRLDADTIRLTIAGSITGIASVKYQYGASPTITGVVVDNTAETMPLEMKVDISSTTPASFPCSPSSGEDLWINQACYYSSDTYHDANIYCTSSGEIHVDNAILRAVGKIVCPIITIINGGKIIIQ